MAGVKYNNNGNSYDIVVAAMMMGIYAHNNIQNVSGSTAAVASAGGLILISRPHKNV